MSNHEGEGNQDKSNNEPESLVQMLDAKCETRFERIESLLADMAKSLKRKDRDHDSSEDESGDKTSGSGRDHNAAKCAKQTSERAQADNSEDKQSEDGEIIDDSVSVADSETNLLDELDRDLDDQESLDFYAFPPFSVIPRVLQKVRRDRAEGVIVVPRWPTQSKG
nr:hypothetical protein BaRGS_001856 [Batillaria attramentaria]